MGGGSCLKYLKRGSIKKREGERNMLRRGGKAGSVGGYFKFGQLEPPYKLRPFSHGDDRELKKMSFAWESIMLDKNK